MALAQPHPSTADAEVTTLPRAAPSARDLVALTKPRLASLVLCTAAGGALLAGGRLRDASVALALVGTTLAVAGAHVLNCWLERDLDARMHRTRGRPLPARRVDPSVALAFGLGLSILSVPVLWVGVNALTGALGLVALLSYVAAYTPMKTRSPWALWVGAVPGALPPLMGYTAVTDAIAAPGLALFAVMFFWQLPHFLAIAVLGREDYARAGVRTVLAEWGERSARWHTFLWTIPLVAASLDPSLLARTGWLYPLTAGVLGGVFLGAGLHGLRARDLRRWARREFLLSLLYLTGLFLALVVDHRAP